MLVARDTEAFINQDWAAVAEDFWVDGFHGLDARKNADPAEWRLTFPDLTTYRDEWLRQAAETAATSDAQSAHSAILASVSLTQITFEGEWALARKVFRGEVPNRDGSRSTLDWQTLYFCRKRADRWLIASFVGYLPNSPAPSLAARFPAAYTQHKTAGPYTPVMGVRGGSRIFALSGQAPLDMEGRVIGTTIEEQSRVTLENCRTQLDAAGLTLADVFKVNVYLTDLAHWQAFNSVYREMMPAPYPARTTIQAGLLPGFLVEVDMWAAQP